MKQFESVKNQYKKAVMHQYTRATKRGENGGNAALTRNELKAVAHYTVALERVEALEAQ